MSSAVSDQVRLKLAYSATEASIRLEILVTETRYITLYRQRTTKALNRLRGCSYTKRVDDFEWKIGILEKEEG